MAKKKQTHAKKAVSSKQEGSSVWWIIAAIVVIALIAFLVMKPGKEATAQKPSQEAQKPAEKGATITTSTAPEVNKKCMVAGGVTGPAIGVVPGTQSVANNVVTATFKNNGKTNIDSSYFSFSDVVGTSATGKTVWKLNSDAIAPGETITYTVDLNQVASELGSSVDTFTIYPVMDGKACENGRNYVIKYAE